MKLSVVIVNWNTGKMLRDCVRSVLADRDVSGLLGIEAIVVDNNSSDGSALAILQDFPSVRVVANSENLGFARATNQGIRVSSGPFILLLNPDTEIIPGALPEMVRFMEVCPQAGAVGAMLLNPDGSLQISAYPEPTLLREAWRLFYLDKLRPLGSYDMAVWNRRMPREVDVLTGACLLLRREALDQCGLLDERFFIFSEDQDLCRRVKSHGWKIFWLPTARVIHCGGQSTRQVKLDMFVRLYREKVAYFRKHRGATTAAAYKAVLLGASVIRQVLSPVALLGGMEYRRRAFELARFYRRLVKELPGF